MDSFYIITNIFGHFRGAANAKRLVYPRTFCLSEA